MKSEKKTTIIETESWIDAWNLTRALVEINAVFKLEGLTVTIYKE